MKIISNGDVSIVFWPQKTHIFLSPLKNLIPEYRKIINQSVSLILSFPLCFKANYFFPVDYCHMFLDYCLFSLDYFPVDSELNT